jgi:hypothetical protein
MFKYIILGIIAATVYFVFILDVEFTNQMIGRLFISGIGGCFLVFCFFKFGLHYKIASVNRFATAFYYAVFEYKKVQTSPSDLDYVDSVRQQAEVALAANFDPTLTTLSRGIARQDQGSGKAQTAVAPARCQGEYTAGQNPGRPGG